MVSSLSWLTALFIAAVAIFESNLRAAVLVGPVVNPVNAHVYYLLSENTWTASEAEAITMGGHLATINDLVEQNWVFATFGFVGQLRRSLWIGLTDISQEGQFRWVSGEPLVFTNWLLGQPDNAVAGEPFVHMMCARRDGVIRDEDLGKWNDYPDDDLTYETHKYGPFHGVVEVVPPIISFPAVEIVYQTEQGKIYQLQSRTNLSSGDWVNVGQPIAGDGFPKTLFDSTRYQGHRFYRLKPVE